MEAGSLGGVVRETRGLGGEVWAGPEERGGTQGLNDGMGPLRRRLKRVRGRGKNLGAGGKVWLQALHLMALPPPARASPWDSMATGRPAMVFIEPLTRSAMPTAQWQGSRTA